MADRYSREKRSEIMRRVRSVWTTPEVTLARALDDAGIPYEAHGDAAGVRVDFILPQAGLAVFVDGCFWHGCSSHRPIPKSNVEFWTRKIASNRRRDSHNTIALRRAGWAVVRVWEHTIRRNPRRALGVVKAAITKLQGSYASEQFNRPSAEKRKVI